MFGTSISWIMHLWLFWDGICIFAYPWKYISIPIRSCKYQRNILQKLVFYFANVFNAIRRCTTWINRLISICDIRITVKLIIFKLTYSSWFVQTLMFFIPKQKVFSQICLCIKLDNWRKWQYLKRAAVKMIGCKYSYHNRFTVKPCIWHTQRKTFFYKNIFCFCTEIGNWSGNSNNTISTTNN